MSILRENIVYTILALVAIVLIGVTIGLQLVIITGQNPTVVTGAAQQSIQQTVESNGQQIAFAVATVTETPAVLIIQPAPVSGSQNNGIQNNQAQPAIVEPTPTEPPPAVAEQATATPPPVAAPTETEVIPPTPAPPTPAPPTPAPPTAVPPTATEPVAAPEVPAEAVQPVSGDAVAFRIGFSSRGYGCTIVSQIVVRILDERLATGAELVSFDSVEGMFLAVANNEVDMTLCYLDPDDRELLRGENKRKIGFKMVQLGSHYWQNEDQKLQMWVNLSTMGELRTPESACLLNFFHSLRFIEPDLEAIEIDDWLPTHDAEITEWVTCHS